MLLPTSCPVCGRRGAAPCAACQAALRPAAAMPAPAAVDGCTALLDYGGGGRELVARLKYRNARSSIPWLADGMAALVAGAGGGGGQIDVVTWVPTSPQRRRQRGFDHAQLLARAVARRLHRPCVRLLRRLPGPAQTGRSLAERRRGPPLEAQHGAVPRRVLLVDDVVTTGATVSAAALALRRAGAVQVQVVAAARTLPPGLHSGMAVCGSVVESRGQPQAKRPT